MESIVPKLLIDRGLRRGMNRCAQGQGRQGLRSTRMMASAPASPSITKGLSLLLCSPIEAIFNFVEVVRRLSWCKAILAWRNSHHQSFRSWGYRSIEARLTPANTAQHSSCIPSSSLLRLDFGRAQSLSYFIKLFHAALISTLLDPLLPAHGIPAQEVVHDAVKIRPLHQRWCLTRSH